MASSRFCENASAQTASAEKASASCMPEPTADRVYSGTPIQSSTAGIWIKKSEYVEV